MINKLKSGAISIFICAWFNQFLTQKLDAKNTILLLQQWENMTFRLCFGVLRVKNKDLKFC